MMESARIIVLTPDELTGIINGAISQHERTIVTDVDRALELYHKFTNK